MFSDQDRAEMYSAGRILLIRPECGLVQKRPLSRFMIKILIINDDNTIHMQVKMLNSTSRMDGQACYKHIFDTDQPQLSERTSNMQQRAKAVLPTSL